MWVYFYVSKERIKHLAHQVDPSILAEHIKNWDIKGSAKGSLEGEASKLLEFVGLKGKLSGSGETSTSRQSQIKFTPSDEVILESVRQHLQTKSSFIDISKISALKHTKKLLKFKGNFKPSISGENVAERIAKYEESEYIFWEGLCGIIDVTMVTSKHSLVSHTPVIQSIVNEGQMMELEGFATLAAEIQEGTFPILPLFFGIQIK